MRSARQPDGLTTDDELTPYIFNDERLVGIEWQVLGGPNYRDRQHPILIFKTQKQQLCISA